MTPTHYNWESIQQMNDTREYRLFVELRNPDSILETREILFEGFQREVIEKNIYNDWEISGIYVYSKDGGFVGYIEDVLELYNKKIVPCKSSEENPYCQIGFCKQEQKWYAWHRSDFKNMKSFSVGTKSYPGSDIFVPSNQLDLIHHIQAIFHPCDRMTAKISSNPVNLVAVQVYKEKESSECIWESFSFSKVWGRGSWTASSLSDAKEMAIDYAERSPRIIQGENK